MFSPYRKLFATSGGLRFSLAGMVARLPISMTILAVTFVIVHETNSYTLAGAVSSGAALINAIFTPLWSRKADQLGQKRVLRYTVPFHIGFGLLFLILISTHSHAYIWMPVIFIAEVFLPNIGGLVRRRWLFALGEDRSLINTAYSHESMVDEIVFIIGPLVASTVAVAITPAAGIIFAFTFMAVGTTAFIFQTNTEPPPHPRLKGEKHQAILRMPEVQAVFLPYIFLGAYFSSLALTLIGFCQQRHIASAIGPLLAIWAAGSGVAAFFNGSIKWKISDSQKFLRIIIIHALLAIPFFYVRSVISLGIALFVSGFGIAPLLVAGYGVVEKAVDSSKITETLAWVMAGLNLGGALPGSLSGHIIDRYGADKSFYVPLACMGLALISLLPYAKVWRRIQND